MSTDRPNTSQQKFDTRGRKFAIVASRFNQSLVDRLVDGAVQCLRQAGANDEGIKIVRCPGALEIGGLARVLAESRRYSGIICIGVVIRGETLHFELVAENAASEIARLAGEGKVAVANCILACDNTAQAEARAGGSHGNKGFDAAEVVLEIADLYETLRLRGD